MKRQKNMIFIFSIMMVLMFVTSASFQSSDSKITPLVYASEDESVPVIIVLKDEPQQSQTSKLSKIESVNSIKSRAAESQIKVMSSIPQEALRGDADALVYSSGVIKATNIEKGSAGANVIHFSTFSLTGAKAIPTPSPHIGLLASRGGTGSGVTTLEPYENITKDESYEKGLIANLPVTYAFTAPELGIYEIAVTGRDSENDIALRVEALKSTSKRVSEAPGTVYKYLNIWAGTTKIKEAAIRFKVNNSWLAINNLAASDVKMVKWDGSRWVQLETREISIDSSCRYYEAKTDTFSSFAITGMTVPITGHRNIAKVMETPEVNNENNEKANPGELTAIIGIVVFIVAGIYLKRK